MLSRGKKYMPRLSDHDNYFFLFTQSRTDDFFFFYLWPPESFDAMSTTQIYHFRSIFCCARLSLIHIQIIYKHNLSLFTFELFWCFQLLWALSIHQSAVPYGVYQYICAYEENKHDHPMTSLMIYGFLFIVSMEKKTVRHWVPGCKWYHMRSYGCPVVFICCLSMLWMIS